MADTADATQTSVSLSTRRLICLCERLFEKNVADLPSRVRQWALTVVRHHYDLDFRFCSGDQVECGSCPERPKIPMRWIEDDIPETMKDWDEHCNSESHKVSVQRQTYGQAAEEFLAQARGGVSHVEPTLVKIEDEPPAPRAAFEKMPTSAGSTSAGTERKSAPAQSTAAPRAAARPYPAFHAPTAKLAASHAPTAKLAASHAPTAKPAASHAPPAKQGIPTVNLPPVNPPAAIPPAVIPDLITKEIQLKELDPMELDPMEADLPETQSKEAESKEADSDVAGMEVDPEGMEAESKEIDSNVAGMEVDPDVSDDEAFQFGQGDFVNADGEEDDNAWGGSDDEGEEGAEFAGQMPRNLGTFVNSEARPGPNDKIPRDALHVFKNEEEVDRTLESFAFSMPGDKPMTHQKPAIAWMMKVEDNEVPERRFGAKRGLMGDDVGLGKTYNTLAMIHNMDRGHSDRLTIITCPLNLVAQWQDEWVDYGLPKEEGPYEITCRADIVSALQKKRTTWIISNHRLSNWKTLRKVPAFCTRNKSRTILEELEFDQELQEVLLEHLPDQVTAFEHYRRELGDFKKMTVGRIRADKYISEFKGQHVLSEKKGAHATKGALNKRGGFHQTFSKVTAPAFKIHRLVVDEIHEVSNVADARSSQVVMRLSRMAEKCWGLTATLITNNMGDLRAPMIAMNLIEPNDVNGFNQAIARGNARDLLNPNGPNHLAVIDARRHIYRPKSVVSKEYMPHPIEIPDADRFVELKASPEEMQIHRLLQNKASLLCQEYTFELGAEAGETAVSATFPALTLGHTLRKARGDPSFIVDAGEMGPCPDVLIYHRKEGRSLMLIRPMRQLSAAEKRAAKTERMRHSWGFSGEQWRELKAAVETWKAVGKPTAKMQYVQDLLLQHKDLPADNRPIFMIASSGDNFHKVLEKWLAEQGVVKGNKVGKEVTQGQTYVTYFSSDKGPGKAITCRQLKRAAKARAKEAKAHRPLCILAQPGAADTGLNLQGANHTILVDLPWTWAKVLQLEGRTGRIGQSDKIMFKVLVTRMTVDQPMRNLIVSKRELGDTIKVTPNAFLKMLKHGLEDQVVTLRDSDDEDDEDD